MKRPKPLSLSQLNRKNLFLSLITTHLLISLLTLYATLLLHHHQEEKMGGGGAMRAATKVATYGIGAAGLRGATASIPPLQEQQSLPTATRKPVATIVSSSSGVDVVKNSVLIASKNDKTSSDGSGLVHRPAWDDWEFAGDEEEFLLDSMHPMPRVVFGGVPSLQEATEATSDLKEALEKEYFFNDLGYKKSSTLEESNLLRSRHSETKACISSESAVIHSSVPKPVFHAFSLLKESPEAQGVVASLASDKNVWDAVMQNEKVMEFIKMQQNSAPSDTDTDIKQLFPINETGVDESYSENFGNEFMEFVEKVKIKVTDIISSLSGFFQNMFGGPVDEKMSMDANGNAAVKTSIGASFMALAVLAIMVAVLKRG